MWMNRLPVRGGQCERDGTAASHRLVSARATLEARQARRSFERVRGDLAFVRSDLVHPDARSRYCAAAARPTA